MHDTGGKDRGIDGSMKLRDGETCSKTFCSPEIPGGSVVKNLSANAGDMGDLISMLGLEDPLEEEMAAHSIGVENPMDRGAWRLQSVES